VVACAIVHSHSHAQDGGWSPHRPGSEPAASTVTVVSSATDQTPLPPNSLPLNNAQPVQQRQHQKTVIPPSDRAAKVAQLQSLDAQLRKLKQQLNANSTGDATGTTVDSKTMFRTRPVDQLRVELLPQRQSPSDTRKVIPFGVRNNNVDVKSIGENVSLVARDAPLKEILAMLAKSQKLNLVFASTPAVPGALGNPAANNRGNAGGFASQRNGVTEEGNQQQPGFISRLTSGASPNGFGRGGPAGFGGAQGASQFGAGGAGGVGSNINANMTVTLEDVPLDTALDTILSVAGFTWTRSQGIILVTPNDGSARLPPHTQGRSMQVFELDFAIAEDLDVAIQGLLSPVGQSFTTTSLSNDNRRSIESIVVEDMPRYMDRIAEYIAQVDIAPRQVAIQAYILEVELGSTMRHGVNLEYLANKVDPRIRFGTTGFARTSPSQAFFLELDGPRLDGLLDVLRTTVDAKTLASPRLIAVNGQESRLQVGEQLGFRVTTTTQTSTLEGVQFINVGVVLSVTPRISRDGRVLLRVQPEVSSGQVNPETGLPEEETAELQTDVLLDDGQGIVVGGLIKEDMNNGQNKLPGVGDVPYFGALFGTRNDKRSRTEIIVALVPKILPLDPERQAQNDMEFQRATTPLMHGSLVENPRPSEPAMPDPLRHPQRTYSQHMDRKDQRQAAMYASQYPQHNDVRSAGNRQVGYEEVISTQPIHPTPTSPRHPMNLFRGMKFWRR